MSTVSADMKKKEEEKMARLSTEQLEEILGNPRFSFFHEGALKKLHNEEVIKFTESNVITEIINRLNYIPQELNLNFLDDIYTCYNHIATPALLQLRKNPEIRYEYDETIKSKYKPKRFFKGTAADKLMDAQRKRQFDFFREKDGQTGEILTLEEDFFRETFSDFINEQGIEEYYTLGLIAEKFIMQKADKAQEEAGTKWKLVKEDVIISDLKISKEDLKRYMKVLKKRKILFRSLMMPNQYWLTLSQAAQAKAEYAIEQQKQQGYAIPAEELDESEIESFPVDSFEALQLSLMDKVQDLTKSLIDYRVLVEKSKKINDRVSDNQRKYEEREDSFTSLLDENKELKEKNTKYRDDLKFAKAELKTYREEIAKNLRSMRRELEKIATNYANLPRGTKESKTEEFLDEFSEKFDEFSNKLNNVIPSNIENKLGK